jgi:hypothetical protein
MARAGRRTLPGSLCPYSHHNYAPNRPEAHKLFSRSALALHSKGTRVAERGSS